MRKRIPLPLGDASAREVARLLGLSPADFEDRKHALFDRGFPQPDETTGLYDLDAVDLWRRARHRNLYPDIGPTLTEEQKPRDARQVTSVRLARLAGGR